MGPPTQRELKEAINDYIAGSMDEALQKLEKLVIRLEGEDQNMAYLYLGRCYVALGDLDKATEAFMLGKSRGWESPFDEYLIRIKELSRASIEVIVKEPSVTRGQLAYLLSSLLPDSISKENSMVLEPKDIKSHWAKKYILNTLRNRYMSCLPDSRFYPDENITRPSLYYIMSTIGRRIKGARYEKFKWLILENTKNNNLRSSIDLPGANIPFASGEDVLKAIELASPQVGE